MAEPIYNWERREKLLEIARRLDELAALAAARVEQAERAAAARRAAHAALLAEAQERIRSFDPLSSRPDPRSLEALYELALRERTAESPGTASDASWDWPSLSDYWHYLIHPSQMDSDLQTYQQIALGTSALALGGAGALTAAGLGGLTVGAAWAAAAPYVVAELTDTAIEMGLSTLLGGSIIVPFSPVDVLQDLAKLNARKFAKEGLEGVAESVASKATRAGDAAGAAAATSSIAKNGETAATIAGKTAHKAYRADEVLEGVRRKEFRLPSGNRVDFIDFENKIIYELKPNNPRAIRQGQEQLSGYLDEVERVFGAGWRTVLDTY